MQETITLTNLQVYAYHGVFEAEKNLGQPFYLTISASLNKPFRLLCDNIENTLNYAKLADSATHFFQKQQFDLIEESAYALAKHLLLSYPILTEIKLSISKPHAPIPLPFEKVAVELSLKWIKSYISIGSNQGDSKNLIKSAFNELKNNTLIKNIRLSPLRETKAWGNTEQPNFLNGVIELETLYSPHELLKILNTIETNHGRIRKEKWGPRTLDLDIIYYGEEVIYTKDLIIPHFYHQKREFVLEPLVDLNPYIRDPISKKTVYELLTILKRSEDYEL